MTTAKTCPNCGSVMNPLGAKRGDILLMWDGDDSTKADLRPYRFRHYDPNSMYPWKADRLCKDYSFEHASWPDGGTDYRGPKEDPKWTPKFGEKVSVCDSIGDKWLGPRFYLGERGGWYYVSNLSPIDLSVTEYEIAPWRSVAQWIEPPKPQPPKIEVGDVVFVSHSRNPMQFFPRRFFAFSATFGKISVDDIDSKIYGKSPIAYRFYALTDPLKGGVIYCARTHEEVK